MTSLLPEGIKRIILISLLIFLYAQGANALSDEDIVWTKGDTYVLTPEDSMITVNEYTIKVVDFPSPVRGIKTMNGTRPQRPVTRYAIFKLYKDIINNSEVIEQFTLGVDSYQIISDKELRITVVNMPKEDSQNWVYEYYRPWVSVKVQKRAIHNLDIKLVLKNINASRIDSGDKFNAEVRIKNTGDESAKDINYNINIGSLELTGKTQSLKDYIDILEEDKEEIISLNLEVPLSIEKKDYVIWINATSLDSRNILYYWNYSRNITVREISDSIWVNKSSKNTIYMKEDLNVALNIVNSGGMSMDNIEVIDFIPDTLLYLEQYSNNGTYKNNLSFNKDYIAAGDSWTIFYKLRPNKPGIYVLPKSIINFSIGGKDYSLSSDEKGFRVYGPILILNKSFTNKTQDIVEIKIKVKNIGNGFASMIKIEDKLPENAELMSGTLNWTTSLYSDQEKVMNYTIRVSAFNIDSIIWPPANATYWLDDYKFTTSSDKNVIEEIMIESENVKKPVSTIVVPIPTENTSQKRVVATISKTSLIPKEKETPGFVLKESLIILMFLILFRIKKC